MPRKGTRNAQGGGTIRKRGNGTWEGRYTVGRDPDTGKQVQRFVYGKTQAEVRKKLQQVTTDIDVGIYTDPSRLTVGGWMAEYLGGVKPRTAENYTMWTENRIKPELGPCGCPL